MARLEKLDTASQTLLGNMPCPEFETQPWVTGPPLRERRVAIISTAGLHRASDRPFTIPAGTVAKLQGDYRIIPGNSTAADLVMSHISIKFDRTGFQQDWNVAFPANVEPSSTGRSREEFEEIAIIVIHNRHQGR